MTTTRPEKAQRRKKKTFASGGSVIEEQRKKLMVPLVGPAFIFYTVLFVLPAVGAIWISLNKWPGYGDMEFVGLGNYIRVAQDELFQRSFINTLLLLFVVGAAIFTIAFLLTLVLRNMWGRKVVRNVIFFPHLINALVFGMIAGFIFNPNGVMNTMLAWFGVTEPPEWLARENLFPLIMLTMVLVTTGYYTTIIMAGVDRIPNYIFEDCALAGATPFQRLWHVIIPLTWDVFGTCAVLWTLSSIKVFEIIWVFGGGGGAGIPPQETWTSAVYTFVTAFRAEGSIPEYGAATASAIISLILVTVLVVLLRKTMRREAVEF